MEQFQKCKEFLSSIMFAQALGITRYQNVQLSAVSGAENLADEQYELILYNGYYPYPKLTLKGGVSFGF